MKGRLAVVAVIAASVKFLIPSGAVASAQPAPKSAMAAPITPNSSWTTYHRDSARTGYDSTASPAVSATTGWVSPLLDGPIYGEPLIY
jgi:hypothetical protein